MINTILLAIALILFYVSYRNVRTYAFRKELSNMALESARKAIDEHKLGEWEKPYDVLGKHSYEDMLFSIKPFKLEAWFTEEEINVLKGGSDEN